MPDFESVHQELGDDVVFVGLSLRESVAKAKELVERTGVTYLIGRDPSGDIFTSFAGVNMPSTFFIGRDGTVVDAHSGVLSASQLREKTQRLLS
jgi:thiol-disulfide isomerase/thioredoxin